MLLGALFWYPFFLSEADGGLFPKGAYFRGGLIIQSLHYIITSALIVLSPNDHGVRTLIMEQSPLI